MTQSENKAHDTQRLLPLMLVLFVGSGCAALIYEIVWFQQLQFVIGASGISLGVLLGTFMAGMFLGSLALPKYVSTARHPLKVYAVIELAIGVLGLLLLWIIPFVGRAYASFVPPGSLSIFLRAVLTALVLLPPTILMGATLPAIARYVEATPKGVSWLGFFYGGNIVGAVVGCLLAGFYLLRLFDLATATFVAVLINLGVALLAYLLAGASTYEPSESDQDDVGPIFVKKYRAVYIAIGLSGLTALGAEVVWTRLMSLILGATTYTFSIILAVFLTGLGLGSAIGSYLARTISNPRHALALCQLLVVAGIAWSAYFATSALPYWPINPSLTDSPWILFQIDVARGLWTLLPAPILWGASFPLAVAAAAEKGQDSGRLMAGIYAANTVGAIMGSLLFGLVLIPMVGTQNAHRILMVLPVLAAVLLLASPVQAGSTEGPRKALGSAGAAWAGAGLVVALLLIVQVPALPAVLVSYGRFAPTYFPPDVLYMGEGINSSIAVTQLDDGTRNMHVGGKVVASTEPQDMRLQRMLGHLTALMHDEPKSVLIVGFGAGVTAGSFVTYPGIERIVIAEIEPLVTKESAAYFAGVNHDVLADPRVEVINDDARHYLLTTDERFDLITADPIHPWMKGAAALYTEEYFSLASSRLNPGGVITQWVPLYESTTEVVKSEIATFFKAFPDGVIWGNTKEGEGYDVVLGAREGGLTIDIDELAARLGRPDHARVGQSLAEASFGSTLDLLSTYAGRASDLTAWTADAEINQDKSLRLQYLAGLHLNRYEQAQIFEEILRYWTFPEGLFTGSEGSMARLRTAIGQGWY